MNHKKKAIKIMHDQGFTVRKSVDKSQGCDHKIILLYTNKGNFVYRYCENEKGIMSHAWACEMWKDLPVPKTIIRSENHLIETMIKGENMGDSKLTKSQKIFVMKQIGNVMREMHKIKTKNYGYLMSPGLGQTTSWKKYISGRVNKRLKSISMLLSKQLFKDTKKFLRDNEYLLDYHKPVLLHQDMNPDNIIVYNGRLSGIIDAADALSGDPVYDIAVMYDRFRDWDREFPDALAKTYGKIDQKKLRYYEVINAIRRIWLRKERKLSTTKYILRL